MSFSTPGRKEEAVRCGVPNDCQDWAREWNFARIPLLEGTSCWSLPEPPSPPSADGANFDRDNDSLPSRGSGPLPFFLSLPLRLPEHGTLASLNGAQRKNVPSFF